MNGVQFCDHPDRDEPVAEPLWAWYCHGCGQLATRCHCLEPTMQPLPPPANTSSTKGAWWTLGLAGAGVVVFWLDLVWPVVGFSLVALLLVIGALSLLPGMNYQHPQRPYWKKR